MMPAFNRGERVRIMDSSKWSDKIYLVKDMKKCQSGGTLYLLKLLDENSVLRLYHEDGKSLLERIC